MFTTRNPVDQSRVNDYHPISNEALQSALTRGEIAQKQWKYSSLDERKAILKKLAQLLSSSKDKYAVLITREMGKVLTESLVELQKCKTICDYLDANLTSLLHPKYISKPGEKAYVRYDPLGGVLGIMPWNFPFWQVFRFAVPALCSGNAAFLKHAPNVLGSGEALEKLFLDAGFPDGLFQHLIIDIDQVEQVIEHPFIQAVSLTGSERAGSAVAAIAGKQLKKTVLELGGSDPFIVLEDADLDLAVNTAVKSRMINCGQSCIAAKRFFVHEKVYPVFLNEFTSKMHDLRQGDPMLTGVQYGPMARVDLVEHLLVQVKKSIEMGAVPSRLDYYNPQRPSFFKALVLSKVHMKMPVMQEEVFGPVASVMPFSSDDEAIRLANSTNYGLGASVWTKSHERANVFANEIESGSVYINTLMKSDVNLPFGGVKRSGYGRELSSEGFYEFVNIKSVVEA